MDKEEKCKKNLNFSDVHCIGNGLVTLLLYLYPTSGLPQNSEWTVSAFGSEGLGFEESVFEGLGSPTGSKGRKFA